MTLSGSHKRYLRGLAHHLGPVAQIGQKGVTEDVVEKVNHELKHHELIKVRVGSGCLEERKPLAATLSEACGAQLVQVIGRVIVLYKPRKKNPEIRLPKV